MLYVIEAVLFFSWAALALTVPLLIFFQNPIIRGAAYGTQIFAWFLLTKILFYIGTLGG